MFFDPESQIAVLIDVLGIDALEIARTGQGYRNNAFEKIPHPLAAQSNLRQCFGLSRNLKLDIERRALVTTAFWPQIDVKSRTTAS